MRCVRAMVLASTLFLALPCPETGAATYELSSGQKITGEPIAPDDEGIIFKTSATQFTPRIAWTNLTESALKSLAETTPEARRFVARYIYDEPDPEESVIDRPSVRIRDVPRVAPPADTGALAALFASPVGIFLFAVLYAANIYAGFCIGRYRTFNPIVTTAASVVIPFLAPLIFLVLPVGGGGEEGDYEEEDVGEAEEVPEEVVEEPAPAEPEVGEAEPAASNKSKPVVYERGKFTFNRRFFETKLAPFLKVVPGEKHRDLVLEIDSVRGHHVGTRVAKILPEEMHLQVEKGGASAEVVLPLAEIKKVTVRPREE